MNVLIKIFLGHDQETEVVEDIVSDVADVLVKYGYENGTDEDAEVRSLIIVEPIRDLTDDEWLKEQVENAAIIGIPMKEEIEENE